MFALKLSTKGIYGVMAVLDMAIMHTEGTVALGNIAERRNLSISYLEQLFAVLRKEGIVSGVRGAQGGYMLKDNPYNITVGTVLRALEGSLAPVHCVDGETTCGCNRSDDCATKYIWEKIGDSIEEVVDKITLGELVKKYESQKQKGYMFYI